MRNPTKDIKIMSGTIRAFSFLIKRRSLFFELIDELTENKDLSIDELICHLVRMFGGAEIKVPSANELRLYQYLMNNAEDYFPLIKDINPRKASDQVKAKIKFDYHGPLHDVEMSTIINGFIETVMDADLDSELQKHDKVTTSKRLKDNKDIRDYQKEVLSMPDDIPDEEDLDDK